MSKKSSHTCMHALMCRLTVCLFLVGGVRGVRGGVCTRLQVSAWGMSVEHTSMAALHFVEALS